MKEQSSPDLEIFEAEQIICKKKEPGGDLLFIIEGRVEVFDPHDGEGEIRLVIMNAGEVIGVATCLTNSPRLASVRALEKTVVRRVKHDSIMKVMGKLPDWLFTLLKDLNLRLSQMNTQYSLAERKISFLKDSQQSYLFYFKQICLTASGICDFIAIKVDDEKFVLEDDLKEKCEAYLGIAKHKVNRIFKIMIESGLLVVKVEPDRKRRGFPLKGVEKLREFATFIDEYSTRKYKAIRKSHFGFRELKLLFSIVKLATKENKDLSQKIVYTEKYLQENLTSQFGQDFDPEMIATAETAGLIEKIPEPEVGIRFIPRVLNNILINVSAYKSTLKIDEDALLDPKVQSDETSAA